MPAPRIDWLTIKDRFPDFEEPVLFVLPRGYQQLLLSIADRLGWEATYRANAYDFADWETLQSLHEAGVHGLLSGVPMQTLLDKIDEVITAIYETYCCDPTDITDGGFYTDPVEDGVGLVPQPIVDAGWVTDTSDWEGFEAYKCMIMNVAFDDALNKMRAVKVYADQTGDVLGVVGAIAAILGTIIIGFATAGTPIIMLGGILVSTGSAAGLWSALSGTTENAMDNIIADLESDRDDIICAMFVGDGPQDAIDVFYDEVEASAGVLARDIAQFMNLGPTIKALYGGRYNDQDVAQALADQGFDTGNYNCVCDQEFTFDFQGGAQGWTGTHSSNRMETGPGGCIAITKAELASQMGANATSLRIHQIDWQLAKSSSGAETAGGQVNYVSGNDHQTQGITAVQPSSQVWAQILSAPAELADINALRLCATIAGEPGLWVDSIVIHYSD